MVDLSPKRYPDLSPTTRALLENMTEQQAIELTELLAFYARLPTATLLFLERSNPVTLAWLQNARPDEISQLDEAIRLVRSSRTVGKFAKWAVITVVGAFMGAAALGKSIAEFLAWIKLK